MGVSKKDVINAYLLFLGRKPENNKVIQEKIQRARNLNDLSREFVGSPEFRNRFNISKFDFKTNKMKIDNVTEEQLHTLIKLTIEAWERMGDEEPYWSVLTDDKFTMRKLNGDARNEFYQSGIADTEELINTILRNNIVARSEDLRKLDVLELGCGTGRVTYSLTKYFKQVYALDISSGNLKIAKEMLRDVTNVEFFLIRGLEDYDNIPEFDIFYSILTLQHNPPPIIEIIIKKILNKMKTGGLAFFQVPTYMKNYSFQFDKYMKTARKGMEMHLLPQKTIFKLAAEENCIPCEVYECNRTGQNDFSTTFVFTKE